MSEQVYAEWDESIDQDAKSNFRGSGGRKWAYIFRFDQSPTRVHFGYPEKPYLHPVTHNPLPFRAGRRHFIPWGGQAKKGAFVECGSDSVDTPCVTCALQNPAKYNLDRAPESRFSKLDAKAYYAVSGWVEEWFHLVQYYKDDRNPEAGTYTERERCMGKGCEYCADDLPKVFGNKFFTEISPGQWRHAIHDINTRIQNSHCACGGEIFVQRFECSSCGVIPEVTSEGGPVLMDISTFCDCGSDKVGLDLEKKEAYCEACGNRWSALYFNHQKIYNLSKERQKCPECNHVGTLVPIRICTTEGCEVKPLGVFDCQLTIRIVGAKKEKRMLVDSYVVQEPDQRLFDEAAQGGDEWAPKIVEANKKPLDLDFLLKPESTEAQAKALGVADPFGAVGRAAGAGRYAKYQRDDGPSEPTPGSDEGVPY